MQVRLDFYLMYIIMVVMSRDGTETYHPDDNKIHYINLGNNFTTGGISIMIKLNTKHSGLFAAGVVFGTAGIKVLSSKDAKKLYTNCTAAVLRAKDCVMKTVSKVQENAEDIYAEAKQINEDRAAAEEAFEDAAEEETVEETTEETVETAEEE